MSLVSITLDYSERRTNTNQTQSKTSNLSQKNMGYGGLEGTMEFKTKFKFYHLL
jgi:hypothetical protein